MKLWECLQSFGWCGVRVEELCGLSSGEIKAMLETCVRRVAEGEWDCELGARPKLAILWLLRERLVNLGAWTWPAKGIDKW